MPNIKSAIQAARYQEKRRVINLRRTRAWKAAVAEFKQNPTAENFKSVQSTLHTATKYGVLAKNKADRLIARFAKAQN